MSIQPDNRKNLINLKKEQSNLIEEAETFRQLILGSSYLKTDRILKIDAAIDAIVYNMSVAYDTKIEEYEKIGNI
jgi:hypothetical protein